jgi:hypothetical protein
MAQKTYLQVESITSEALVVELEKRFSKIIDSKLSKLQPPTAEDRYISRQEVADMFSITLASVHNLMNAGVLKPYKIGHKTRFLLSETKAAAINTGRKLEVANAY